MQYRGVNWSLDWRTCSLSYCCDHYPGYSIMPTWSAELRATLTAVQNDQINQETVLKDLQAENLVMKQRLDVLDAGSRHSTRIIRGIPENTYAEKVSGVGSTSDADEIATWPTRQIQWSTLSINCISNILRWEGDMNWTRSTRVLRFYPIWTCNVIRRQV